MSIKTSHWIRRRKGEEKVLLPENATEVIPKSEVRGGETPPGRRRRLFSAWTVSEVLLTVADLIGARPGRQGAWAGQCRVRGQVWVRTPWVRKPDHATPQHPGAPLGKLCELSPGAWLRGSALGCRAEGFSLWALRSRAAGQATWLPGESGPPSAAGPPARR